jgi:hypothetical protein
MAHGDRTLGCIGILGGDQLFADFENNLMYVIKKNGGHVRLRLGSPDADSIVKRMSPTMPGVKGRVSDYVRAKDAYDAPAPAIPAPLQLPGAKPSQDVGETLKFDNRVGLRNRALRDAVELFILFLITWIKSPRKHCWRRLDFARVGNREKGSERDNGNVLALGHWDFLNLTPGPLASISSRPRSIRRRICLPTPFRR